MSVHRYAASVAWRGSTGAGYRRYDRGHVGTTPPAAGDLALSADPAFRGDAARHNPEQLLLLAASSCQLLSFLALAARAGVDVLGYSDDAEAVMPTGVDPLRITDIWLRPVIVVAPGTDPDAVIALVHRAHEECYVASTLTAQVHLEPTVAPPDGAGSGA